MGANLHATWMLKWQNFCRNRPLRRATLTNSALPGAARCALASPLWQYVACRDGSVSSNTILSRGVEAVKMTNRKSGKNFTFCLIALDPQDRLRYPLVSLFFDMCWWLWLARGVWENLFDIEFARVRVGSLVQKWHGSRALKWRNFRRTGALRRASSKNSALPGAARCALASPLWQHVACRDGYVFRPSNTVLQPGRRSGQDGEQKSREKNWRFA